MMSLATWSGKRVLVTGHAGFKGGWLSLLLSMLGARVFGYGRVRSAGPSFYHAARVRDRLTGEDHGDTSDVVRVRQCVDHVRPDIVFHLAARAIVLESLDDPWGTITANVTGAASILDAVRSLDAPTPVVLVTTDKVYRNGGQDVAFAEEDRLGGLDPYGASKAAIELVADSYRHCYGVRVTTARCANVVGGGDWGPHRLVPNCFRAAESGEPMTVYPALRVFLHVLDASTGYLAIGERLLAQEGEPSAFNIGPDGPDAVPDVARAVFRAMGTAPDRIDELVQEVRSGPANQASRLDIDSTRARELLGWRPRWTLAEALERTVAWHEAWRQEGEMALVSQEQIREHLGSRS